MEPVPRSLNLYVDASLSMKGYVVRQPDQPQSQFIYRAVLRQLDPAYADAGHDVDVSRYKFGRRILEIDAGEIEYAARFLRSFSPAREPSFYDTGSGRRPCVPSSADPECIYQESRLGDVFNRVTEQSPEDMSVIVTDLFLRHEEVIDASDLIAPLARLMSMDRAIAIVGIKSRFNGTVYDLPQRGQYDLSGWRPFFVVVVGSLPHVVDYVDELEDVLATIPDVESHRTIFTTEAIPQPITLSDLAETQGIRALRGAQSTTLLSEALAQEQQYVLSARARGIEFVIDLQSLQIPNTPHIGSMYAGQEIWLRGPESGDCRSSWTRWPVGSTISVAYGTDSKPRLQLLDRSDGLTKLVNGAHYFVRVTLFAETMADNSPESQWFREWDFPLESETEYLDGNPEFFKVLNLNQLNLALRRTLSREIEGKVVGDIQVLVWAE